MSIQELAFKRSEGEWSCGGAFQVDGHPVRVAFAARAGTTTTPPAKVLAATIPIGWQLKANELPLIGKLCGDEILLGVTDISVLLASDGCTRSSAKRMVGSAVTLAGPADQDGSWLDLRLANVTDPVRLRLGRTPAAAKPQSGAGHGAQPAGDRQAAASGAVLPERRAGTPPAKAIGPLRLGQVGLGVSGGKPRVTADAAVTVGPLVLDLHGLGVAVPLGGEGAPEISLQGVGFEFKGRSLSMGCSAWSIQPDAAKSHPLLAKLASKGTVSNAFAGRLTAETLRAGVSGDALFAEVNGRPVLVATVEAKAVIGGPPAFFITGFLGMVGLNTRLEIPDIENLDGFPLLDDRPNVADLGRHVAFAPGNAWVAAGVVFTSFRLIDGRAVVVANLGPDPEFALLGRASLALAKKNHFAAIQLDLSAAIKPAEGFVGLSAVVASGSYLLDRDCRLSGAAAFHVWTKAPHAGDFVLSIGGYHPRFPVPPHYPRLPRVAFGWNFRKGGAEVALKGDLYLALTPSCVMTGGRLEINYRSGNLRAWAVAHVDALAQWVPFHFSAEAGLVVGVDYTINILGYTRHYRDELGVHLALTGPPTAGSIAVRWWVVRFTISFGSEARPDTRATWADVDALLPPERERVKLAAPPGLQVERDDDGTVRWLAGGTDFVASVESCMPVLKASAGGSVRTGEGFHLRPMRKPMDRSDLAVTIERLNGSGQWTGDGALPLAAVGAIDRKMPTALWGDPAKPPSVGDTALKTQLVGLTLRVGNPPKLPGLAASLPLSSDAAAAPVTRSPALLPQTRNDANDALQPHTAFPGNPAAGFDAKRRAAFLQDVEGRGLVGAGAVWDTGSVAATLMHRPMVRMQPPSGANADAQT